MTGERDLRILLAGMHPVLQPGVFVFVTIPYREPVPPGVDPMMVFRESEGRTLIIRSEDAAAAGLQATFRSRMVTLDIHSSLEAVGFLAAVTSALASEGIGVNPVAGYFHDHLFVPEDRAEDAVRILETLAANSGA